MRTPVTVNLQQVAKETQCPLHQLETAVELLDAGNPVPFIARYRKDETGNLDEEQLRTIQSTMESHRKLAQRKETILRAIETHGKLTPELEQSIRDTDSAKQLEDLYLPYKPKKQTLAAAAVAKGLQYLADEILAGTVPDGDMEKRAAEFCNAEKGVESVAEAILGAGHIISETYNEKLDLRQRVRDQFHRIAILTAARILPPTTDETTESEVPPITEIVADTNITPTSDTVSETVSETIQETTTPDSATVSNIEVEIAAAEGNVVEATVEIIVVENSAGETASGDTTDENTVDDGDFVTKQFNQWREKQQETGLPIVRSQKQLEKKRKLDKQKQKKADKKTAMVQQQQERFAGLFQDYFTFQQEVRKLAPHRILAMNRGERAKILKLQFQTNLDHLQRTAEENCVPKDHPFADFLKNCLKDTLQRLMIPSLEREIRSDLTTTAETHAVRVFAKNLRSLLLQRPLHRKRVLALDPGFRHGCKMVALDEYGNVLGFETVWMTGTQPKREQAAQTVKDLVKKYHLTVFAVGNGTGCRETEQFVSNLIAAEKDRDFAGMEMGYVIVNEAGASVYSASPIAREELPEYDILQRSAVSIGRRLQDPLNELVKIEPASLGVGMYQHDVKAKHLQGTLDTVVESCVNCVGVDLNAATPAILRYVAGLNQLTARRIYEYRMANGPFKTLADLRKVSGIGDVAFTHAAGFLRIPSGFQPLDSTWIHPESYPQAIELLAQMGFTPDDLRNSEKAKEIANKAAELLQAAVTEKTETPVTAESTALAESTESTSATEISVPAESTPPPTAPWTHTQRDILAQFAKPGRDPREELPPPIFKQGVIKLEDLSPDMELTGTVLNVVDFGAFVDIGLHESGLVHISHLSNTFVRDASEVVSVGDVVRVWVREIDTKRNRVSLSMLPPGTQRDESPPPYGTKRGTSQDTREPRRDRRGRRNRDSQRDYGPKAFAEEAAARGVVLPSYTDSPSSSSSPPSSVAPRRDSGPKSFAAAHPNISGEHGHGTGSGTDTTGSQSSSSADSRSDNRQSGNRFRAGERGSSGGGERGARRSDRSDRSDRSNRSDSPKVYSAPPKDTKVAPITENMKKGKEPLRSFGDLAQLFGRVTVSEDDKAKKKNKK